MKGDANIMSTFHTISFTGGMNDFVHPALLDDKTAQVMRNALVETGKLVSVRDDAYQPNVTATGLGHYGTNERSAVKWYGRYYWSYNNGLYAGTYGSTDQGSGIGVPYPEYPSVRYSEESPGSGEGSVPAGTYKYCLTYMNANGWEGAPGSLTDYEFKVTASGSKKVRVYFPTLSDELLAKIKYVRVWRTIEHGAEFYLLGSVDVSGENPPTYFDDTNDDSVLAMHEHMSSISNYPPPTGGKFLTCAGGIFFLAVGDKVYFSELNNPHAWPTLNFVGISDTVTGIVPEFQGVLVYTTNSTFRIVGADNVETVTMVELPGNQGCKNWRSIASMDNSPMWLSNDGVCRWDGEKITVVSQGRLNTKDFDPVAAVAGNECYYLFGSGQDSIVYDVRAGGVFRKIDTTCNFAWYDGSTDKIYLSNNGRIYAMGENELSKKSMRYLSGRICGNSEVLMKRFGDVAVVVSGKMLMSARVDGRTVLDGHLLAEGNSRLKLPRSAVGKYLEIEMNGIGEIDELAVSFS